MGMGWNGFGVAHIVRDNPQTSVMDHLSHGADTFCGDHVEER